MRRSDFSSLKTLIVRSYFTKKNIPKAIASLSVSQFVATSLTRLEFKFVHFDKVRSLEFNRTLRYFAYLRCLNLFLCDFDGSVCQAIKQSFLIDDVFWGIWHQISFEELLRAIVKSQTDRTFERTTHYIHLRNQVGIGTKETRIMKHIVASIEKCSATKTSRIMLGDISPTFELGSALAYLVR